METHSLGELELEILRYVAAHAPISARDVAQGYGQEHGLAKTTVLTVMERLRTKKYLTRSRREGIFHYSTRVSTNDLMQQLVRQFVRKTLGGSVSPFVAYLSEDHDLSDEELTELQTKIDLLKGRTETKE